MRARWRAKSFSLSSVAWPFLLGAEAGTLLPFGRALSIKLANKDGTFSFLSPAFSSFLLFICGTNEADIITKKIITRELKRAIKKGAKVIAGNEIKKEERNGIWVSQVK
ncbi:hypothetical protein GOBAR_DD28257 [Gossypium barbadense]|nr:hypothetical protein GOBAR_DD28257 [Gossypium barbadense]